MKPVFHPVKKEQFLNGIQDIAVSNPIGVWTVLVTKIRPAFSEI